MKTKRNIYILYAIAFLQGMVFYGPVATLYRQAAGVSVFQITVIESISLALCIGLELPWGIAADKIGYKRTMIISCAVYFLSKVVFWRADGFADFLLERILLSVVMAGMSGCDVSILYLSSKEEESQKVFGIYQFLSMTGLLMSSLLFSVCIGEDYRLAGFLTMVSYGAAAVFSLGIKEVKGKETKKERGQRFFSVLIQTVKDRNFLLAIIGMALLAETNQTVTVFLSQLQYVKAGMDLKTMGVVYILVTLAGMTGMWSYWFTRRLGSFLFGLVLFLGGAAACLVLSSTESAVISVGAVLVLRLSASLFSPLSTQLQNRRIKGQDRATALSIYAVVLESTGVVTNILFGRAAEEDISNAMVLGAVLCVAGACLFSIFYRREGKNRDFSISR
ncbi:MFS transporter [Lacrimispora sp. JR3]|uniref:MFS transporter n=1 Tax=Lacrimispora sinapis TaxID=3111456 RepID=UPI00374A649C